VRWRKQNLTETNITTSSTVVLQPFHACFISSTNDYSTFFLNEQPSIRRAFPPVGWHKTWLQFPHKTTDWAWLNTVVLQRRHVNDRQCTTERISHVKASRTLHIHEKAVRSWYKPLELVFTLLGSWIRVKQIVLNLLPNESVDCWNTTSTAGICESKTRYIRKWPKEAKKNRHDSHNMPMINISFSCCLKKISTTNITKFQEAPSLTTSDPKYGICPLPTRHKEHERISY